MRHLGSASDGVPVGPDTVNDDDDDDDDDDCGWLSSQINRGGGSYNTCSPSRRLEKRAFVPSCLLLEDAASVASLDLAILALALAEHLAGHGVHGVRGGDSHEASSGGSGRLEEVSAALRLLGDLARRERRQGRGSRHGESREDESEESGHFFPEGGTQEYTGARERPSRCSSAAWAADVVAAIARSRRGLTFKKGGDERTG